MSFNIDSPFVFIFVLIFVFMFIDFFFSGHPLLVPFSCPIGKHLSSWTTPNTRTNTCAQMPKTNTYMSILNHGQIHKKYTWASTLQLELCHTYEQKHTWAKTFMGRLLLWAQKESEQLRLYYSPQFCRIIILNPLNRPFCWTNRAIYSHLCQSRLSSQIRGAHCDQSWDKQSNVKW